MSRVHTSLSRLAGLIILGLSLVPAPALGQADGSPVTLSATGGIATGAADTHGAVGGTVVFDVTDRLGLEGSVLYLDRGPATYGVAASGNLVVSLVSRRERLVPYALGGFGVYHAGFDLQAPRYLGPIGPGIGAGSTYCPGMGGNRGPGYGAPSWAGTGTCQGTGYWAVGDLPEFYARRLGSLPVPANREWGRRSFTDPAFSVGGGLNIRLTNHWQLRPDARALIVIRNGHTHTLGVYTVSAGYRF